MICFSHNIMFFNTEQGACMPKAWKKVLHNHIFTPYSWYNNTTFSEKQAFYKVVVSLTFISHFMKVDFFSLIVRYKII